VFPVEVEIRNDPDGRPRVTAAPHPELELRVSIAHKGDAAVAIAAAGRDVGIDIERVEPRPDGFTALAFHEHELALIGGEAERDAFLARLWAAKEAVGKLRGSGLGGDPRRLVVADRTGERFLCEGVWVDTRREADYVIAWTLA
jgi:phosphopantetheinyl transferase